MAVAETKIGLGGFPYKDGENVLVEGLGSATLGELIEAMRMNGAEVEHGVLMDDGTILLAGND